MSGMSAGLGSTPWDVGRVSFFPEFPRPGERAILSTLSSCTSTSSHKVSYSPRLAMRFSELFQAEDVLVGFAPTDKWDAIRRLVDHLTQRGRLKTSSAPAIVEAVVSREKSMSTGMEHGIAIPHAAVEGVEDIVAVLGICPEGIAFDSIDQQPARILVGLVIPRHKKLMHIKTLAEIARLLSRAEVRQRLLTSRDAQAVVDALREFDGVAR